MANLKHLRAFLTLDAARDRVVEAARGVDSEIGTWGEGEVKPCFEKLRAALAVYYRAKEEAE